MEVGAGTTSDERQHCRNRGGDAEEPRHARGCAPGDAEEAARLAPKSS